MSKTKSVRGSEKAVPLGSMFVGCQKFPGLWGHNFVGSKFDFINKYKTDACIYVRRNVNSWARVNHENIAPP